MPFVVTEPCIQCKFTDCVAACPVDCFRDGPNFLVIDPDECIDCGACVPECPVEAIFDADSVPEEWTGYIDLNKKLAAVWPSIRDATDPLPTSEAWRKVEGKDQYLHLDAEAAAALGRSPYGPAPKDPPTAGSEPPASEPPAAADTDTADEPAPPAPEPVEASAADHQHEHTHDHGHGHSHEHRHEPAAAAPAPATRAPHAPTPPPAAASSARPRTAGPATQ